MERGGRMNTPTNEQTNADAAHTSTITRQSNERIDKVQSTPINVFPFSALLSFDYSHVFPV